MKRKYRWVIFIAATLIFIFFGRNIAPIPITDRSMVVAMGIDLGNEKPFLISVQILVPNSSGQSAGYSTRLVNCESTTLIAGMSDIGRKTGKYISLTHCSVLLLGEDLVKNGKIYVSLAYLSGNSYLSDDAVVFCAKGKASEVLNKSVAFENSTSSYIQNLTFHHAEYDLIATRSLQDFIVAYHQKGAANFLPILELEEAEKAIGSTAGNASSDEKEYLFNLSKTAIVKGDNYVCATEPMETFAINAMNSKMSSGKINIKGDKGENITLFLINKKISKKFDVKSKKVTAKLKFMLVLKEIGDFDNNAKSKDRVELSESEVQRINAQIEKNILDYYKKLQELDVDVFGFTQSFFSRNGNMYNLSDINLELKIDTEWI